MNILILGGTYFIGRAIVEKLLEKGSNLSILNRGTVKSKAKVIKVDRRDSVAMYDALRNKSFDVVIDVSCYSKNDVEIFLNSINNNIGHYIFCSSIAVCKQPPKYWPIKEDHEKCSSEEDNEYGYNKLVAEEFLFERGSKIGFDVSVIRPTYVYGPEDYNRRVDYIFEKIENNSPVVVRGNGNNIIQLGYVEDLAEAFIAIIDNDKSHNEAFNVSGNELVTVRQFVEQVAFSLGKEAKIVCLDMKAISSEEISSLPEVNRFADAGKAKKILGIFPKFSLEDGIKKTAHWWLEKRRIK